jgi:hypothetical protein
MARHDFFQLYQSGGSEESRRRRTFDAPSISSKPLEAIPRPAACSARRYFPGLLTRPQQSPEEQRCALCVLVPVVVSRFAELLAILAEKANPSRLGVFA